MTEELPFRIGSCSWKYDSWIGLIYSESAPSNYLKEYATRYNSVEIDQWFWSLFPGTRVKLPNPGDVQQYSDSVPDDFRFSIKVPNSITLTHYYRKSRDAPLEPNPHFLSHELFNTFLDQLAPLQAKLGPLLFQFEYLNRRKMPGLQPLLEQLSRFFTNCPAGYQYAVELRNPNFLQRDYFQFLNAHQLGAVLLQGYYMPPITKVYEQYHEFIRPFTVIRLLGPDRQGIEKRSGKRWNRIVDPRDQELAGIYRVLQNLLDRSIEFYVNVNNHYEGAAPHTIRKILENFPA